MKWKNVIELVRVDMKSGRLIRGQTLTKYREGRLHFYLLYGGALVVGLTIGTLIGIFYGGASILEKNLLQQVLSAILMALPTLILIFSLIFTMMQQIQRSGVKASVQVPYWLPITWEEHTLASIFANYLGLPLGSIVLIGSTITVFSIFTEQFAYALLSLLAMVASALMASTITEILRVLQNRFVGAVYKSSGRTAVWIRFVGSLLFFVAFYVVYFFITSGSGIVNFIQGFGSVQNYLWFVPFLWPGITVYYFMNGLFLLAAAFSGLSLLIVASLFYAAVTLNAKFGLYEPPAITISRGIYSPRTGFLRKMGLSLVESALIKKDFKAFTRRRELMYIFILPIVIIIPTLMQSFGGGGGQTSPEGLLISIGLVFLLPSSVIAIYLGSVIIGEEGTGITRIYSSPISAQNLVKSKYVFMLLFSIPIILITGIVGIAVFHPNLRTIVIAFTESFLLVFALSAVSLTNGIKGADFTELPRPRMIRTKWALINFVECFLATLVILSPLLIYVLKDIPFIPKWLILDPSVAVVLSTGTSLMVTFVAYKIALRNCRALLANAEN